MTDSLNVTSERVDDTPVLLAQIERMGIAEVLNLFVNCIYLLE